MTAAVCTIVDADIENVETETYVHLKLATESGLEYHSICLLSKNRKLQERGVEEFKYLMEAIGVTAVEDAKELLGFIVRYEYGKTGKVMWTPAFDIGLAKQFFDRKAAA